MESELEGVESTAADAGVTEGPGVMEDAQVDVAQSGSADMTSGELTAAATPAESEQPVTQDADDDESCQLPQPGEIKKDGTELPVVKDVEEDVPAVETGDAAVVVADSLVSTGIDADDSSKPDQQTSSMPSEQFDDKTAADNKEVTSSDTGQAVCDDESADSACRIDWDALEKPKVKSSDAENAEFSQVFNRLKLKQRAGTETTTDNHDLPASAEPRSKFVSKQLPLKTSKVSDKVEEEAVKAEQHATLQSSSSSVDKQIEDDKSVVPGDKQTEIAVDGKTSALPSISTSVSAARDSSVKSKSKQQRDDTKPSSSNTNPASPNTKPASRDTKPASSNTKPLSPGTKPSSDTKPAASNTKPVSSDTKPSSPGIKPASRDTKPASSNTKPASDTKLASSDTKPASPGTKPASPDVKPASPGSKPASSDTKLASSDTKPTSQGTKPVSSDTKLSSPDTKPASPIAKPASRDIKPASPGTKPASPGKYSAAASKTKSQDSSDEKSSTSETEPTKMKPSGEDTKSSSSPGKESPTHRAKTVLDREVTKSSPITAKTEPENIETNTSSPPTVAKKKPQRDDRSPSSPGDELSVSAAKTEHDSEVTKSSDKESSTTAKSEPENKETNTPYRSPPTVAKKKSQKDDRSPSSPGEELSASAAKTERPGEDISLKPQVEDVSTKLGTGSLSDLQNSKKTASPAVPKKKPSLPRSNVKNSSSNVSSPASESRAAEASTGVTDDNITMQSSSTSSDRSPSIKKHSQGKAEDQLTAEAPVTDNSDSKVSVPTESTGPCDSVTAIDVGMDHKPPGEQNATSTSAGTSQLKQEEPGSSGDQNAGEPLPSSETSAATKTVPAQQKKVVPRRSNAKVQPSEPKNEEPAWILAAKRKSDLWSEDRAEEFERKPPKPEADVSNEVSTCSCCVLE